MNISSGPLFGPLQPQPDFSVLSGKYSAPAQDPFSADGGMQAISYGGSGGTDFSSLSGEGGNDLQSMIEKMQMQTLAEMMGQLLQTLLPMLQQMMSGAQSEGNGPGSNTAPENALAQAPEALPTNPAVSTATALPEESAVTTPGSGITTSAGSSGLHLPESLKRYEADIMNAAEKTGVPPEVLAGQIWQESRGKADAVTVNGGNGLSDSGVMQVNSNTFADLQSKNPQLLGPGASPSNSSDSIMAGALYMKEQLNAFGGNMGAALRAYNSGPGNVNVNDLKDISKTGTGDATYVDKVMKFANTIASGNGTLPA